MGSHHPYYRKVLPTKQLEETIESDGDQVHLSHAWPLACDDKVAAARQLFDARAAAVIRAAAGIDGCGNSGPPQIWPLQLWQPDHPLFGVWVPKSDGFHRRDLLGFQWFDGKAPGIYVPGVKCLALLAYLDYFPDNAARGLGLRAMVSRAVLAASPGWCGTFGPGVDGTFSLTGSEGNYDLSQMHLIAMVYHYYDALSSAAREYLIAQLLAHGRIHRPNKSDTFTSGRNPDDWNRAGFVSPLGNKISIGETENHILMIVTARYLTNQLLFQRDPLIDYDNRRNGGDGYPSCLDLLLSLLRNALRGDFSEYNAKSYQTETRWALLNLCTYAYDHEVRLGARMVLDYLSAHMAVSSNDLRRLIPFRRRNEDEKVSHTPEGFMTVGLLDWARGADVAAPNFAMQAGNLRACELPASGSSPVQYGIRDPGQELATEVLSDYRLPLAIHDLFVNDRHRRFFQRLHRTPHDEVGGNRNCDNMEIFASSPSYLITAGGQPATWAIDPSIHAVIDGDKESIQRGVAMTTSFMPTWPRTRGDFDTPPEDDPNRAAGELIQFGEFSSKTVYLTTWKFFGQEVGTTNTAVLKEVANYGVAPDFACGHQVHLPGWCQDNAEDVHGQPVNPQTSSGFCFVNMRGTDAQIVVEPGFYLAIFQQTPGGLALLEAFDCLLHPELKFWDFKVGVIDRNRSLQLQSNVVTHYTTTNSTWLEFVMWRDSDGARGSESGAQVLTMRYGDATDAAGRADLMPASLVNGAIMNSPREAVVEIAHPARPFTITLDFSDLAHPSRHDSATGEFESAGSNNEVWLDFEYSGPTEGDVCRPFNTITGAVGAVNDNGVIRVVPGATGDRGVIGGGKRFTLLAPIGGVSIGTTTATFTSTPDDGSGAISDRDIWVQFGLSPIAVDQVPNLFTDIASAVQAVADTGIVHIEPGHTDERPMIGGKRMTLVAPIGGVKIGGAAEVWVDFAYKGPSAGILVAPFIDLQSAMTAVPENGIVNIMPGQTTDRSTIRQKSNEHRRMILATPCGGVILGTH
jgi:hypothetical protein